MLNVKQICLYEEISLNNIGCNGCNELQSDNYKSD